MIPLNQQGNLILHVLFLLLLFVTACQSTEKTKTSEFDITTRQDHIQFLRVDTVSGYLYDFYQEKCPGTTISERNAPCVRKGNIFIQDRINEYSNYFKKDSLLIFKNQLFVLDFSKVGKVIPLDFWYSSNSTSDDKINNEAKFYLFELLYEQDAKNPKTIGKNCNSKTFQNIEIIECKIYNETALIFSVTRDLIRYATSPDIGIANRGMPLKYSHDSLRIAWFVPKDSPILNQIPKKNN